MPAIGRRRVQQRYKARLRAAGRCSNGDHNPLSVYSTWYCDSCQARIRSAQVDAGAVAAHERLAQGQWRLR